MKRYFFIASCLMLRAFSFADDAVLTIPGDAKGAALGEAYSASASGADGLWYNPAALSRPEEPTVSVMHTSYLEETRFNTLGVSVPFGRRNAAGFGVSYLSAGSISSYDNTGAANSSYSPNDLSAKAAVAKSIGGSSFGVSLFYLRSTIVETATSFGLNAGLHQLFGPLSLALVAENFGGKLAYETVKEKLPSRLRFGTSLRILRALTLNTDIVKGSKEGEWIGSGLESLIRPNDHISMALRAGYNTRSSGDISGLHGLTAGAGFGLGDTTLNYAWVPYGDLGQTHRISLDFPIREQPFTARADRDYQTQALFKSVRRTPDEKMLRGQPQIKNAVTASSLPKFPWKVRKGGWRTAKEKMIDLLARDALCSSVGARALITRTSGSVALRPDEIQNRWQRVKAGRYVFEGETIKTGVHASAHVFLANGVKTEIGANTIVKVYSGADSCDLAEAELKSGEIYAASEDGKELHVKTALGDATIKDGQARIRFDGKMAVLQVDAGTSTFVSEGTTVPVRANTTFARWSDGKTEKTSNDKTDSDALIRIVDPDPRGTPGRWDKSYAKGFSHEMMRLDSVPGLQLAEYVRDTALRKELKLKLLNEKDREQELVLQMEGFNKDVLDFTEMKESLRKALKESSSGNLKETKLNLKQAGRALANAQRSLATARNELRVLADAIRKDQEFLAGLPIVRMLNITAQESTIPFETGVAEVPEESRAVLDSIADAMTQMRPSKIVIEGHTDKTGSVSANRRLSKQRADAVAGYLREKTGFPQRQFITKGMAFELPLDAGETPDAMAKNRRVEIWFELRGL